MAEEALKKLEQQLNCSICLDTYTNPKLLQCFHIYCQQCLVPLVDRDQRGQLGLSCPICRQVTPVPNRGVAGLQSAFHINHLLELKDSFQKLDNPAVAVEGALGGVTIAVPSRKAVQHCFEHPEEELKLYCETCGELVCLKCAIKGGKHFSHDYKKLDKVFQEYKEEITSSLEPMERQVATMKGVLAQLDTRCGKISDQREATEDKIHATFRRLLEVLNVRETELVHQLHRITQSKLKALAVQRDKVETILAQLSSCLLFMGESLREANKDDALMMKTNTVNTVKELTTPFQPDSLKPSAEADIIFTALGDLHSMCRDYGQVFAQGSPDPSKCHATGKGLEVAVVGEKSTCILHAVNGRGMPCEGPIMLECELVSQITATKASCSVVRRESQYEISYQPTIKGRHQLRIRVEGQHIRGSPFSIAVKLPVEKLGTPILTISGVVEPCGVSISQRGDMVVTDWDSHCVHVFGPSGDKLRSIGTHGSGKGQFDGPQGVAVDGEGNILVADFENHRIQKFTAKGQFLTAVGTKGSGLLQFFFPTDIAISDKVYVVDSGNYRVQILKPDLTFSFTFGKKGSHKGQFQDPCGIACDSTGKVYVTDFSNNRIQVFTAEGKFLRMFGHHGQGSGELNQPTGIAIDTSGVVYVSEGGNDRVSLFTSDGQFVTSFGRRGEGPGEFDVPTGLALDSSGVLYVCGYRNNRVQLF